MSLGGYSQPIGDRDSSAFDSATTLGMMGFAGALVSATPFGWAFTKSTAWSATVLRNAGSANSRCATVIESTLNAAATAKPMMKVQTWV